jgi:uncharacterized protein (TIGR00730 family)
VRRVCVFCGSSPGRDPRYVAAAREMALALVARGEGLVFGGGSVGLMGVLADALLAAGGEALGVIPHGLVAREIAHRSLTEMRVVPSMHARKALMAELSDAFIALPGGFGTFEELLEMVTWAQLGIHRKPIGLLNVAGYYDSLIALVDHAVREGFVPPGNRGLILVDGEPGPLLERLSAYQSPARPEWITPGEA